MAGRVESKGALVISQSSQGRLQVDLIQRSDSQSSQDQVEMIFYNASIGYSLGIVFFTVTQCTDYKSL